jgi:hypothetical protein
MPDKTHQPGDDEMLATIRQPLTNAWTAFRRFLVETYQIEPIFNLCGKKYGWSLQYLSGGRSLCEMYPKRVSFTALVIQGKSRIGFSA